MVPKMEKNLKLPNTQKVVFIIELWTCGTSFLCSCVTESLWMWDSMWDWSWFHWYYRRMEAAKVFARESEGKLIFGSRKLESFQLIIIKKPKKIIFSWKMELVAFEETHWWIKMIPELVLVFSLSIMNLRNTAHT